MCIRDTVDIAGTILDGQPVRALPRTNRPTFGVQPGSGADQNRAMGQSAEFGQFLRVMRARMRPEDMGLSTTSTARRVPGLRREEIAQLAGVSTCLLYTSPSPRDGLLSRMPSSA